MTDSVWHTWRLAARVGERDSEIPPAGCRDPPTANRTDPQALDTRRTLKVLRRWAEIPPERMPDIIKHMDFYCSLRVYRALLACGQIELARVRLLDLVRYKGGVDGLNHPEAEKLCGWEMGRPWKESLAWRLMRHEHPNMIYKKA